MGGVGKGWREVGLCIGEVCGGGRHKVLILWEEICAGKTGSQTVRRERWDGTKRNSGDDYSGVAEWQRRRAHRWRWRWRCVCVCLGGGVMWRARYTNTDVCTLDWSMPEKIQGLNTLIRPHGSRVTTSTSDTSQKHCFLLLPMLSFFSQHLQGMYELYEHRTNIE